MSNINVAPAATLVGIFSLSIASWNQSILGVVVSLVLLYVVLLVYYENLEENNAVRVKITSRGVDLTEETSLQLDNN